MLTIGMLNPFFHPFLRASPRPPPPPSFKLGSAISKKTAAQLIVVVVAVSGVLGLSVITISMYTINKLYAVPFVTRDRVVLS